ncbi:MAG: threonine synthase [Firmicutes bacterium]|nr:threonine synthase [Bacillota bacterium]
MKFYSTRDKNICVSGAEAIALGLAPGGGLFVPECFPAYAPDAAKDYPQLARDIFGLYLDEFSADEIAEIVRRSYQVGNFPADPAPLASVAGVEVLELWHGPTAAFKDMALQALPHLLSASRIKAGHDKDTVILVATSGDTGKAALAGFAGVEGTQIIVFYPLGGVSRMQELQMLTTDADNAFVVGVRGNFDDCQRAVKTIFNDAAFRTRLADGGKEFSSANSINFGRLMPQIVYYYHAYNQLLRAGKIKMGDKVDIAVPSGNFGNILAACYAGKMGLPVRRLVCASNENRVLTDVIASGRYDRRRDFFTTASPSMDILVSSNFERYVYHLLDGDTAAVAELYAKLDAEGVFELPAAAIAKMKEQLWGGCAPWDEVAEAIDSVYAAEHYVMDPHTAVGYAVCKQYQATFGADATPLILASTASPYKFPAAVLGALGEDVAAIAELEQGSALAELTNGEVHYALRGLDQLPICQDLTADKSELAEKVADILHV